MLQVADGEDFRRKYVAVAGDLGARLIVSDEPIATAPEYEFPRDFDASRLLAIAKDRELTQVEQFFAAMTMPNIWRTHGGGPVPALLSPSVADAKECENFAREFVQPAQKLSDLARVSPAWNAALAGESEALSLSPQSPSQARPRF